MKCESSRRGFLKIAAGSTGALVLAACAPQQPPQGQPSAPTEVPTEAPPEAPAKENVQLRVTAWGDVPDKNINDRVAAAFHEANADIVMVPETYPGNYYDKIKVNLAGGNSADLLYMEGYQWQPFASTVIALNDYIAADNMASAWPDVANYSNLTRWRDKTYLSVIDTGSMPMFYNKTIFDMAEVPYPTNDWTFSDFKALVKKLTFEKQGVQYYGFELAAGAWVGGYVWWVPWIRMDGALEFDRIVEPQKANWTQPEIVDALQFVAYDCIKNNWSPTPDTVSGGGVSVATDRVAMGVQGPWYLPQLRGPQAVSEGGVKFDVVMPPKGAAIKPFPDAEIQGHMIWSGTKYKDQCWELMKFWMGEEPAKITAEEGRMCGTPANTEKYWVPIASESFSFEHAGVFVEAQSLGQSPMVGGAGANFAVLEGAGGPLASAAEAMYGLQKTAAEAMAEANPAIQKLLDDYWVKQTG